MSNLQNTTQNNLMDEDWNLSTNSSSTTVKDYDELTEEEIAAAAKPSKACLLNDPDCEACQ